MFSGYTSLTKHYDTVQRTFHKKFHIGKKNLFKNSIPINFLVLSVNNTNISIKYPRHYKLEFMQMNFLSL